MLKIVPIAVMYVTVFDKKLELGGMPCPTTDASRNSLTYTVRTERCSTIKSCTQIRFSLEIHQNKITLDYPVLERLAVASIRAKSCNSDIIMHRIRDSFPRILRETNIRSKPFL